MDAFVSAPPPCAPARAEVGVTPVEVGCGGTDPVTRLQRWEAFGAHWQVVDDDGRQVTLALCRCDGGEEVDRLTSADPALRAFLDGRTSSVGAED